MVGAEVAALLDIALILFVAKLFGEIAERLRIDSIVGEIAAGLLLGPVLHFINPNGFIAQLSGLGILVLLFLLGLSTKLDELKGHFYSGAATGTIAALASVGGGIIVGLLFFGDLVIGIIIGVGIMSTSTAIPIKILLRMGQFRTRAGQFLVAVSMADDIVAIIALSMLSAWLSSGAIGVTYAATLFFVMLGFIYFILTVGAKISNFVLHLFQRMKDEQSLFAIPLVILFGVAFAAESLGVAAVTGAFLAGMAMANSVFAEPVIAPKIKTLGYGFLVPIFFAYSAVLVDLSVLLQNWALVLAVIIAATVTKIVGSMAVSRLFGFRGRELGIIGIGMVPRGEYEIIIAQIALTAGIISNAIYGAMIATVVVTTIITPVLYSLYLRGRTAV